jgi:FtsH-binding integral membrane protein
VFAGDFSRKADFARKREKNGATMAVTKDKLASLLLFAVIVALATVLLPGWGVPGFGVCVALFVSVFGLILIWFAEPLAETSCFTRGVAVSSPPILIEAIGWLFLVGYPLLLVLLIRTAPVWAH